MFVPLSPLEFKRRAARLYGEKTAVVDGDRRFTYGQFAERTNRLANGLLDLGLSPGDRVAFLAYNSYPLLEGYYGVLEVGGVLLPLNIRLSPGEITYILNDAGAAYLFADADFAPVVDAIWPSLERKPGVVWLSSHPDGRQGRLYDRLLAESSPEAPAAADVDENAVAELFYTSGTTGQPKGVMLTHRNLYLHALDSLIAIRATNRDVQLHTIPLFHVNGWGTPQALTAVGGTHVMMRKFDPGEALRLVEQEKITRFFAVPTMLNLILSHPDVRTRDLSSLNLVMTGGAPTPPDMVRRGEEILGCEVIGGYGLSETSPILTFASDQNDPAEESAEERWRRRASTGLPIVGVELKLLDGDGNEVPWDGASVGEIVVRSNVVMKGYWKDDEATERVMGGGWFRTGDMAVVEPNGYVTIVDRSKDIIVSGGENISSVEIEKTLYEHPAVLETAVIGIPDGRWGEVPAAVVALRPGSEATADELIEFCRERMAAFKVPKRVDFAKSLPKGGTGKILKRELREPYWSGYAKRVH
jgi:fatty-acyl-CoA synthase